MAKIYVASSWRNQYYPSVVEALVRQEAELMYKRFSLVTGNMNELIEFLDK